MNDEAFLRAMLASPEDEATRLIYADWLEERGDPRAELLRHDWDVPRISFTDWSWTRQHLKYYLGCFPELRGKLNEPEANTRWRDRVAALGGAVDPEWLAAVDTLGRPFQPFFFWNNSSPRSFEPAGLPFREQIGTRGMVLTFESAFRGDRAWGRGLLADLRFLLQLRLWNCAYGAASCPIHRFVCEIPTARRPPTGADVLEAIEARDFRSQHIPTLDAARIPYPGYHPETDNDEIHTDPAGQILFPRSGEAEVDESDDSAARSATHEALRGYVGGGRLWYVLLHGWNDRPSDDRDRHPYVVLFAVGRSPHGNRLLGVVSHQVCRNFCD